MQAKAFDHCGQREQTKRATKANAPQPMREGEAMART